MKALRGEEQARLRPVRRNNYTLRRGVASAGAGARADAPDIGRCGRARTVDARPAARTGLIVWTTATWRARLDRETTATFASVASRIWVTTSISSIASGSTTGPGDATSLADAVAKARQLG